MRVIHALPGGVHPPEKKELSNQQPIQSLPLFDEYIVPIQQHIGIAATPIVSIGDKVLGGQLIGTPTGAMSAGIHAPTSGEVVAIEARPIAHPSGLFDTAIVIRSDGEDKFVDAEPMLNWRELGKSQLIERIATFGVTGLGGAGFPTSLKLNGQRPIKTLIINGTECEPYITADDMLMREHAADIRQGVEIIAQLLEAPDEIIIGIEDNKPEALGFMRQAFAGTGYEVVSFPTKYPSGGEKQLIQILTGREVPSGDIPAALGIVVQNVGTAAAIKQCVVDGIPITSRVTTVTGEGINGRGNFHARIGSKMRDVLSHCDSNSTPHTVVMGGPMMGFEVSKLDAPIVKSTNCLLVPESTPHVDASECIRCGLCAEVCPASLLPQQLYWYAKADDHEKLNSYHLSDCIECGACAFVCPSSIPLVQHYRAAKGRIKEAQADQLRADRARQRFEFRKSRIEAAEAEREAKRLARKKAAEEAKKAKAAQAKEAPQETKKQAKKPNPLEAAKAKLAKAKTKESDSEAARLEKQLKSVQDRIALIERQISEASEDEAQAHLRSQLDSKLATAKLKLEQLESKKASSSTIERAESALEKLNDAKSASSVEDRQKKAIDTLKTNIEKTQKMISNESDDTKREKLEARLSKLQEKLASEQASPSVTQNSVDEANSAAQQAIEKAKRNTAAMSAMSDDEKRLKKLEQAKARLEKAKVRLAKAEQENDEHLAAYRTAVEKLETTISQLDSSGENS